MEFCCHARAVSAWICWLGCEDGYVVVVVSTVIVAGLNQFYRYYLRRDSSDMADLVLLYFHYCDRLDEFLHLIPWCYKDVYGKSFCSHIATFFDS